MAVLGDDLRVRWREILRLSRNQYYSKQNRPPITVLEGPYAQAVLDAVALGAVVVLDAVASCAVFVLDAVVSDAQAVLDAVASGAQVVELDQLGLRFSLASCCVYAGLVARVWPS